jgi:hypothetical protein
VTLRKLRTKQVKSFPYGENLLPSNFDISAANGVDEDTGLSVSPPESGIYEIACDIRGVLQGLAGVNWRLEAKLYNTTDNVFVDNSARLVIQAGESGILFQSTAGVAWIVEIDGLKTFNVYVQRDGGGSPTWTYSRIGSDYNGYTTMRFKKIADIQE